MFVAATETADPCGTWFVFRLTFHGDAYLTGAFLNFPMLGQDTNALLLSLRTCLPNKNCFNPAGAVFTVFEVPKSNTYSAKHVDFDSFQVDSLTAPVTNAGQPMIASPVSFFLAAVPGTGYKLYRLTNSGGSGASFRNSVLNKLCVVRDVVPGTGVVRVAQISYSEEHSSRPRTVLPAREYSLGSNHARSVCDVPSERISGKVLSDSNFLSLQQIRLSRADSNADLLTSTVGFSRTGNKTFGSPLGFLSTPKMSKLQRGGVKPAPDFSVTRH
jgi:hypothetical protein